MTKNNSIGLIVVAIFIIAIFAYIDFFASPISTPSDQSTSTPSTNEGPTLSSIEYFPNGTFVLKLNESESVLDATITPWAILEESRCAKDVQCIQAGRVVVGVNIVSPTTSSSIEIKPGDTATTSKFLLTLKDVSPYPVAGYKIQDDQYRFIFYFEKP